MAPDQLLANPKNWRVHPKAQQEALAGVLDRVGWVAPVMVNQATGLVVDGHLRVALALTRGEATIPVSYVDLTPDEEALVLASYDPLAGMAVTDQAKLEELWAEVALDDRALEALLHPGSPRRGLTDPDAVPDPSGASRAQTGDVWVLGDHRLACGDCRDPETVRRLLDGAEPTLLVTDPPYGGATGPIVAGCHLQPIWPGPRRRTCGPRGTAPGTPSSTGPRPSSWSSRSRSATSGTPASMPRRWPRAWCASASRSCPRSSGTRASSRWGRSWYHWAHEPCWVVRKPGAGRFLGRRNQATVWRIPQRSEQHDHPAICCEHQSTVWRAPSPKMIMAGSKEERLDHPAQKPVVLYDIPILNHSGDVFDPFGGCGTSIIAAEQQGRRCFAIEVEPRYVEIILARWEAFTGREAVRG